MISFNRRSATESGYALPDPALKSRARVICRSATRKTIVAFSVEILQAGMICNRILQAGMICNRILHAGMIATAFFMPA